MAHVKMTRKAGEPNWSEILIDGKSPGPVLRAELETGEPGGVSRLHLELLCSSAEIDADGVEVHQVTVCPACGEEQDEQNKALLG